MISWPCLLKLDGDDELIFLDSEQTFLAECFDLILCEDDYVVDSKGLCYLIGSIMKPTKLALINTKRVLDAAEVTQLIRCHEFKKAEFCLTKIHFLTVSDAIQALSY